MKKIISFVLTVCLLVTTGVFSQTKTSAAKIVDNELNIKLQQMAETYFNSTIASVKENDYDYTNLNKIIDNSKVLNFEKERSKYTKKFKSKCNDIIYSYEITAKLKSSEISSKYIINTYDVKCTYKNLDGSISYVDDDAYALTFAQNKKSDWAIVDIKYPERVMEAYPMGIETNNWGELHKQLDQLAEPKIKNQTIEDLKNQELGTKPESIVANATTASYGLYNRRGAVEYALKHTENWWDCLHASTDTDKRLCTVTYSPYFNNYNTTSYSTDCANFSSQCIWAGFGGIELPSYINSHQLPMDSAKWYGDPISPHSNWINNCPSSTTGWISIFANNYTNNSYGVQVIVDPNASNLQVGDLVWGSSHSMIITSIVNGEIRVSGHTRNNKEVPLSQAYTTAPTKYIRILQIKLP